MKRIVLAFLFTWTQLAHANTAVKVGSNVQQSGTYFRENYTKNGTFEQNNENSITDANAIATVSASSPMSGTYSLAIDAGTSGHLVKMLGRTMTQTGGNCEATFTYTGDASLYKAYVLQSSTKVSAELTLQNAGTNFIPASLIFPCGAGTAPDVTIEATSASAAAFKIDDVYAGQPVNIGTVAQASFFGGMEQAGATGCVYAESTSTGLTDFKDLGTGSGCNAWTVSGSVTATGTNDHRPIASNMAPGMYQIVIGANFFSSASAQSCYFRLSDGTTTYQPQTIYPGSAASASLAVPTMSYHVNYTTAQSSVTFKLQASDDGSGECRLANGAAGANTSWKIYYFPSAAQTVVNMNQSNYDWIACPTGYASSWTANTTTTCKVRRSGGDAEFQFANTLSGAPTAATLTFTLPSGFTIDTTKIMSTIQYGQTLGKAQGYDSSIGTAYLASVLYNSSTSVVLTYESSTAASASLYNATAPITWATGDIITASFKVPISGWTENQNAPLLVGGVTSNTSGMERVERARITGGTVNQTCASSPCTVYSQSGSWLSGVTRSSTGLYVFTFASGMFSALPSCIATGENGAQVLIFNLNVTSTTAMMVGVYDTSSTARDAYFNVNCQGPR